MVTNAHVTSGLHVHSPCFSSAEFLAHLPPLVNPAPVPLSRLTSLMDVTLLPSLDRCNFLPNFSWSYLFKKLFPSFKLMHMHALPCTTSATSRCSRSVLGLGPDVGKSYLLRLLGERNLTSVH